MTPSNPCCPWWANRHPAIESRVARIKARVAELTGTMEGSNAPRTPETPQKSYP